MRPTAGCTRFHERMPNDKSLQMSGIAGDRASVQSGSAGMAEDFFRNRHARGEGDDLLCPRGIADYDQCGSV